MGKEIKKPPVLNNQMTALRNTRRTVVLDGSNIVHGGRGPKTQGLDGNRLMSAIALYESKGYVVIPCMKGGTFHVMSGEALNRETGDKIPKAPGFDSLQLLNKSGFLRLFSSDDDLYIIHIALLKNAWIVTNDTFEDSRHPESGESIPRERTSHPELDWDLIDEVTWGTNRSGHRVYADDTWKTEGPKFIHPTLSHAPTSLFEDEYTEIREAISQLSHILQEVVRLSEKEDSRMTDVNAMARNWVHSLKRMAKMIPGLKTLDRESLTQMTVQELKKMCLELDLKRSGKKAELVDRILQALPSEETSEESQEHVIFIPLKNRNEAGAIIGAGGKRIRAIQEGTGAWVVIDDIGMTVQVRGSKEAVDQAKKEIELILKESVDNSDAIRVSIPLLETMEIKRIIGAGGRRIQAIKADTGAWLTVQEDNMVVIIEGSQEQTDAARSQVEKTLNGIRPNEALILGLNRLGKIALRANSYEQIKRIGDLTGARLKIHKDDLTISSSFPDSIQKARELVEEALNEASLNEAMVAEAAAAEKKAAKKARREGEKNMTEEEKRQAQSKRDKAAAAEKKARREAEKNMAEHEKKPERTNEIVNKFIQVLEREIHAYGEAELSFTDILNLGWDIRLEYGISEGEFLDCFNASSKVKRQSRVDDRVRALLNHIQIEYEEIRRYGIDYAIFK